MFQKRSSNMKFTLFALVCYYIGALRADEEYIEVSGPYFVQSSRSPKRLSAPKKVVLEHSWFEEPFIDAEESIRSGVHAVQDFAASEIHSVENGIGQVANTTEQYVGAAVTKVSTSVKGAVSDIGHKVQGAANQTKYYILQKSKEAKGFLSSTFHSVKNWFSEIEDEAKELIHFALRIIEIVAVIAILGIFIWLLRRFSAGYRFVKGVAESFEMDNRNGPQTV